MTEFAAALEAAVTRSKLVTLEQRKLLHKPIYGAAFQSGQFFIASTLVVRGGLHAVDYFVIDGRGLPIAHDGSIAGALGRARAFLSTWSDAEIEAMYRASLAACQALVADDKREREAEIQSRNVRTGEPRTKPIPRRRQQVFDKSAGCCHYCGTTLTIDGKWHIEHKMPRALLGGNEMENLVASCVPCNMRKRDKTDLEFQAQMQGARA